MTRRLRLYGEIIDRHEVVFTTHARSALLAQEAISIDRLVISDPSTDAGEEPTVTAAWRLKYELLRRGPNGHCDFFSG